MRPPIPFLCSLLLAPCVLGQQAPARPDWNAVGTVLGAPGKVLPDGTFRIDVPRADPPLRNEFGFVVPPSMVLTYAAFTGTPERAFVVGDTCMLPEEVNPVLDALRQGNLEIVAIHNHMLGGTPNFIFLHFQGSGSALAIGKAIRAAWDRMGKTPAPKKPPAATPPKPDWKAVSEAMGLPGTMMADGMYKVTLPRPHLGTKIDAKDLAAGVGLACWVGFAPCECGETMIMGDTCLLRSELQPAIDAYRQHGIRIVAIHNHTMGTTPELIFCHFAGEGEALELARAVKGAWQPLGAPAPPK
ncbi:MAG: DUF1259 domain-containing protein [Planctomycetota bacterium]